MFSPAKQTEAATPAMFSAPRNCATLIGDIVGSKAYPDGRDLLQHLLIQVLNAANGQLRPLQPFRPTIGDEFQACFESVPEAVRASLLLRLTLLGGTPVVDSRYGLGYGLVTVYDPASSVVSQDREGWWGARAAIEQVHRLADKPRTSFARTRVEIWNDDLKQALPEQKLNAYLASQDFLIGQMSQRQCRLFLGVLLNRSHHELADQEGIKRNSVSRSLLRSGAYAILEGLQALTEAYA